MTPDLAPGRPGSAPVTGTAATTEHRSPPEGVPASSASIADGLSSGRSLVLFDGVCHLCQGSVRFVAERDPQGRFAFVPLQSATGQRLLLRHGLAGNDVRSLVLVEAGRVYTRSTGALRIARQLSSPWRALGLLLVVPASIRDAAYDWIARNRYRWFGRSETCEIPSPVVRARLVDDTDTQSAGSAW